MNEPTPNEQEAARRRDSLLRVVSAAQCIAGAIAARQRGDPGGAANLLASVSDPEAVTEGAMLLAEVSLGLYREQTGESMDSCVRDLNLRMEAVARVIEDPAADDQDRRSPP